MTRIFSALLLTLLLATAASAQDAAFPGWKGPKEDIPTIDLARLGLGAVLPWAIETDGNPQTQEFALLTASGIYLWNPATECTELLEFYTPFSPTNLLTRWTYTLIPIAPDPRYKILVWDTDARDEAPISVQPIVYKRCQP